MTSFKGSDHGYIYKCSDGLLNDSAGSWQTVTWLQIVTPLAIDDHDLAVLWYLEHKAA